MRISVILTKEESALYLVSYSALYLVSYFASFFLWVFRFYRCSFRKKYNVSEFCIFRKRVENRIQKEQTEKEGLLVLLVIKVQNKECWIPAYAGMTDSTSAWQKQSYFFTLKSQKRIKNIVYKKSIESDFQKRTQHVKRIEKAPREAELVCPKAGGNHRRETHYNHL